MFKALFLFAYILSFKLAKADVALTQVNGFGSNPGNLKMFYYSPKVVDHKAPLIVLLHGCAQSASEFDDETGWTKFADENGFFLLLPQQNEMNNPARCFNWFEPADIGRDRGEAGSIAQMVEQMQKLFNIDARKVFITGLSAGGAMASVMLATYPEMFAAGAIVAGIPYGCAFNSTNAWSCMFGTQLPIPTSRQRGDAVRRAAGNYKGPWPRVMIVHGTADEFVNFKNALYHVDQWTNVHGINNRPSSRSVLSSQIYLEFKKNGQVVVSSLSIQNHMHGYPIDPKNNCGEVGKFVLDAEICASRYIADFFKL